LKQKQIHRDRLSGYGNVNAAAVAAGNGIKQFLLEGRKRALIPPLHGLRVDKLETTTTKSINIIPRYPSGSNVNPRPCRRHTPASEIHEGKEQICP